MDVLAIEYGLSALSLGPETPTSASAAVAIAAAEAAVSSPESPRRGLLSRSGRTGGPPSPVRTAGVEDFPTSMAHSAAQAMSRTTGRSDSTQALMHFGGRGAVTTIDPTGCSPAWSDFSEGAAPRAASHGNSGAGSPRLSYQEYASAVDRAEPPVGGALGSINGTGRPYHHPTGWDTPSFGGVATELEAVGAGRHSSANRADWSATAPRGTEIHPHRPFGGRRNEPLPRASGADDCYGTAHAHAEGYPITQASLGGYTLRDDRPSAEPRAAPPPDIHGHAVGGYALAPWPAHAAQPGMHPGSPHGAGLAGAQAFAHSGPAAAQALDARTPNPRKLFVGGLSLDASDTDLVEHFSQFGAVTSVVVMRNKVTGAPRGFGFVVFENGADAASCLAVPQAIRSKPIDVSPAYPKQQAPARWPPPMPFPGYGYAVHHHMGPGGPPPGFAMAAPHGWGHAMPMMVFPAPPHLAAPHRHPPPRAAAVKPARADGGLRRIFVGGLPQDTTEDELFRHFARFGEVVECEVMRDRINGRSRGFGFVTYASAASADAAVGATTQLLRDVRVDVSYAHPREVGKTRLEMMTPEDAARSAAAAEGVGQPHALGRSRPAQAQGPPNYTITGWNY